jgi:hypothetical protein
METPFFDIFHHRMLLPRELGTAEIIFEREAQTFAFLALMHGGPGRFEALAATSHDGGA